MSKDSQNTMLGALGETFRENILKEVKSAYLYLYIFSNN